MGRARELAELASAYDGGSLGFRNRIINGDMRIDQRNAGASLGSGLSTFWPVDRFQFNASIASKFIGQQTPSVTETGYATRVAAGFSSYLAFTSASAYSLSAGDYFFFRQRLEGLNTADLAWGTSSAKTVTLSFWVNASLTGTYSVMLTNSGQARTYIATYTVNAANTWEQKTITISGDQAGTWLITNGVGIEVSWCLGAGSTFTTSTLNTWSSNFYLGATGQVNVAGTSGATFYITGVQLEAGSVATPFERRDYGREFDMCRRYFERLDFSAQYNDVLNPARADTTQSVTGTVFYYPKRATPTFSSSAANTFRLNNGVNDEVANSVSANSIKTFSARLQIGKTTANLTLNSCVYVNTETTGGAFLAYSAEL